jgi:uncharacterized membrane protein YheB (UPF0754 family)
MHMKRLVYLMIVLLALLFAWAACDNMGAPKPAGQSTPAPAAGATTPAEGEAVAWVNNKPILKKQLEEMVAQMPPQIQDQIRTPEGLKTAVENLVGMELIHQKAVAEGYDKKTEVKDRIAEMTRQVVLASFMQDSMKNVPLPDEAAAKKFYEETSQLKSQKFEDVKERILEFLFQQEQQKALKALVEQLKTQANIKYNDQALASVNVPSGSPTASFLPPSGGPAANAPSGAK